MPNRTTIASGVCTSAYTALYASSEYEKMKKNQELKKAKELEDLQDFFGLQVSTKVQKALALQKAEELRKSNENNYINYFTNEKSTYHWIGTGFGLYSSPTK